MVPGKTSDMPKWRAGRNRRSGEKADESHGIAKEIFESVYVIGGEKANAAVDERRRERLMRVFPAESLPVFRCANERQATAKATAKRLKEKKSKERDTSKVDLTGR